MAQLQQICLTDIIGYLPYCDNNIFIILDMQPTGIQEASPAPGIKTLKIAILGNQGVGKKAFVQAVTMKQNQDVKDRLIAQLDSAPINVHVDTTSGAYQVSLYLMPFDYQKIECEMDWQAQDQVLKSKVQARMMQCDCALLMFSVTDRQSYQDIPYYFKQWTKYKKNAHSVLVATHSDVKDRKLKPKNIIFHRKKNIMFYEISNKFRHSILKPIEYLLKRKEKSLLLKLTNVQNLFFPSIPDKQFEQRMQQILQQYKQALNPPLKQDNDF